MRGLDNPSQQCYLNATMQCLAYCPHLANYFLASREGQDGCAKKKTALAMSTALARFVRAYWTDPLDVPLQTTDVRAAFFKACKGFAQRKQGDAHEALLAILGKVHDGLCRLNPGDQAVALGSHVRRMEWEEDQNGATSVVSEVFRSQLEVRVVAPSSDAPYVNVTYDHPLILSLSVKNHASLPRCIASFMAPEVVPDFLVDGARKEAHITKKFTHLPRILIFHLKRFDGASKIDRFISYPMELHMGAFCDAACPHFYRLFFVCMHHGDARQGHYTACGEVQDRWFCMDDASATPMSNINDIIDKKAYILAYKRIG